MFFVNCNILICNIVGNLKVMVKMGKVANIFPICAQLFPKFLKIIRYVI